MTTSERRRLRALAEQFPAAREALLSLAGPRRAVKAAKKERLASVKVKRAEVSAETRAIREAVMRRADGRCERCGLTCLPSEAHLHHFRGGSGRRRVEQSPGTCVALCPECHRYLHAHPQLARAWGATFMRASAPSAEGATP